MSIDMCATCKNCDACTFPRQRPVACCDEFADYDSQPTFRIIRADSRLVIANRERNRDRKHAVAS